jgi:hypothetical protein
MTSQRDETVGGPAAHNEMADNEMAGDRMAGDPIIVERHDEILAEDETADDPIILERHDEILAQDETADGTAGDSALEDGAAPGPVAGDSTAGDSTAGDSTAGDSTAGDSVIGGAAADSTLDGAAPDRTPSDVAGPSDELAGRHAAPDAGGADPAPLVMPPRSAPVEESITDDPAGPAADAAGSTAPGVPGAPVATSSPATSGAPAAGGPGIPAAALSEQQWPAIQAMFVDDPKGSVQRAAAAADEVVKALVASIEREQAALNTAWENDASTEDLRTALQQYRAFCGRLEGLA